MLFRLRVDALVADPGTLNELRARVLRAIETSALDVIEYVDSTRPYQLGDAPIAEAEAVYEEALAR